MADSAAALLKRHDILLGAQANARTLWQDIADYVIPYKGNIITQRTEGAKQTDKLFDSTAPHARQLLSSSLSGTMTPATQPWLSLKMRQEDLNEDHEVRDWLEDCARRMHAAFRQSTFYQSAHELYEDLTAFAIGALYVEERPLEADGTFAGFRFMVPAVGTYAIAEDFEGRVDTLFRTFSLSLRAAAAQWGTKIGDRLLEKARQKPDELTTILHAVYPRTDRQYRPNGEPMRGPKGMAWASCYVAVETKTKIEEGGFPEFPYCVPRWSKTAGEVYGRGPSHTALPDIKSLNAAKEFILKAAPLAMQPPSLERDDSDIGEVDRTPGARIVVSGPGPISDQFMFLDTKQRVDMDQLVLAELRGGIRAIYFTDQLILHEKPQMTATEVLALQEQMQRLLGPTTGRLESEFLNPLVQRCFGIMARAGAFLPLPQALQEMTGQGAADLDIEYEGPLARAQRTIELAAQDRVVAFVSGIAQSKSQFPDAAWDVLKIDQMIRDRGLITGLRTDSLASAEEVAQIRATRSQAQLDQQKFDRAMEGAKTTAPLLRAVADAKGQPAMGQEQAA